MFLVIVNILMFMTSSEVGKLYLLMKKMNQSPSTLYFVGKKLKNKTF